jgi:hypothetical protein
VQHPQTDNAYRRAYYYGRARYYYGRYNGGRPVRKIEKSIAHKTATLSRTGARARRPHALHAALGNGGGGGAATLYRLTNFDFI